MRVCLNMIVKNELANLPRCLGAMAGHVDACVICDTGSTDDTVGFVERFWRERGVPVEVARTTFRTFEQARNEGLEACRRSGFVFDYILLCDADMELVVEHAGWRDALTAPAHTVVQRHAGGGLEYANIRLLRRDVPAVYRGVTHEFLDIGSTARPLLKGIWYRDHASGANRGTKFERDIALLREALRTNPDDARSVFYLANSYFDLGDTGAATEWYARRLAMAGWDEERFYSSYRIGLCHQRLGREDAFTRQMLTTFDTWPHRAEPLHALALHEQRAARQRSAYLFARAGSEVPKPADALFVEPDVYDWRLLDIMGVSLYYMGRREEALGVTERVLTLVPERERERIRANIRWCMGLGGAGGPDRGSRAAP